MDRTQMIELVWMNWNSWINNDWIEMDELNWCGYWLDWIEMKWIDWIEIDEMDRGNDWAVDME